MGKGHFHVGHAGSFSNTKLNKVKRAANADCKTGGFYKSPSAGQTISSNEQLTVSWDTSCLNSTAVDIYLTSPGATNPLLFEWKAVGYSKGTFSAPIQPKWWNDTSSVSAQILVINSGDAPFMATLPAGPVFTIKYDSSNSTLKSGATNTNSPGPDAEVVGAKSSHKGPSKGGIAAAVIFPLLIVIGLAALAYIKLSRARGKEKRRTFSEAVDKRMSVMSTDWKSITAAGANAAIRQSMALGGEDGPRASTFSFSAGIARPESTFATEGGQAGVGSNNMGRGVFVRDPNAPEMSQLRQSVRSQAFGAARQSRVSFADDAVRKSRVSFADGTRPSMDRHSVARSRAFHTAIVPPLPTRTDSGEMSPTQKAGAFTLDLDDIQTRLSVASGLQRPSTEYDMAPALSMMRTGEDAQELVRGDEVLFNVPPTPGPEAVTMPEPVHSPVTPEEPRSPVLGLMPMQPIPAPLSPDALLRAYADGRRDPNGGNNPVQYNGSGMRVLYAPQSQDPSA